MELQPATLAQVKAARNGRMVAIEDDVLDVVRQIRQLDASLHVRYSEAGGYFVVYQRLEGGEEHLVLTANELDQRIVQRCMKIMQPDYDVAAELEAQDAKREADHEATLKEQVGEIGERLRHAIRHDLGLNTDSAFIKE